jgi:hypothetical protein
VSEKRLEGLEESLLELADARRGDLFPAAELGDRGAQPGAVVAVHDRGTEQGKERAWLGSRLRRYWRQRHGPES